jgi:hypothetical protein
MRQRSIIFLLTLLLAGCGRGLPQVTPTVAPSPTPTLGSTDVAVIPTFTPIVRLTSTATNTIEPTITITATFTESPTLELPSATPTLSRTPHPTNTPTPEPSGTPSDTPTPLPTDTPTETFTPRPTNTSTVTRTPTETFTPSLTPPPTVTPFITVTPSATDTPSLTPTITNTRRPTDTPTDTNTPVPSATETFTLAPTFTFTPRPTNTPAPTETPQPTLTLLPPSDTPTPTESSTPTLPPPTFTLIPTETFTPSITPTLAPTFTPTFDLTQSAALQLTLIRQGQLTQAALPTWTPAATNEPTRTLAPQDVTPNVITATPGGPEFPDNINGITSTPEIVANLATPAEEFPTLVPTPTALPPEIIQRGFPTPLPAPRYQPYSTTNLSTYRFSIQPGTTFAFNGAQVSGGFSQFAANPVYPGSFVYIDLVGIPHFAPPGGSEGPLSESPFYDGYSVPSLEENKNRVRDIGWSPNGEQYFFIVDPPNANPVKQDAGVWYWQPNDFGAGHTYELLVDCMPGYESSSCQLVSNRPADYWQSLKAQWSPDSGRVLVTLWLPNEGRQALTIVNAVPDHSYKTTAPEFTRYEYGYWTPDGRVVVSGRQPDGTVIVGITDGNLANTQVLLNASAANLWMRDAFMRPDGNIVAFGREGGADGPVKLYLIQNGGAIALSGDIGGSTPVRIDVAEDGTQAVVSADGTQYTVNANSGSVIATELRLEGFGPPGGFEGTGGDYPTGVLPNSRYAPGQQVQMVDTGRRNVRSLPGTSSAVIDYVDPNEYVGILAGPYDAEGLTWWYVNTARNQQGWFAGQQGDLSFLNP